MKVVLDHVTKIYKSTRRRGGKDVLAVDDFDFELPDGLLIGLLGPSGCGKSTTLNLISGLESPTKGRIFFDSEDVTELPPEKRGVGMVFQNYALYPHMTVRKNIVFPLENLRGVQKLPQDHIEARVKRAAELVQIEALLDRKPGELSGGEQQRVAIARALVKIPRVLLLDEPLSNLDARLRLQTREEIRRIQKETGVTTIFVTHDQEEAMSISDIIILMKDGVVQQIGKPQEVYDDPVNLFVAQFLGTPQINVFDGRISGGDLYIGEERIMQAKGPDDGPVTVGIRPEGLVLDRQGVLTTKLSNVEVMGRDTSVVSTHEAAKRSVLRAVVSSDTLGQLSGNKAVFSVRPSKVHLFSKNDGRRLVF